jgi:hypothetical protein
LHWGQQFTGSVGFVAWLIDAKVGREENQKECCNGQQNAQETHRRTRDIWFRLPSAKLGLLLVLGTSTSHDGVQPNQSTKSSCKSSCREKPSISTRSTISNQIAECHKRAVILLWLEVVDE